MIATAVPLQLSPADVRTNADLVVFLAVGALAGAHCLGMCGPLVSVYADRISAADGGREGVLTPFAVRQHLLFNLGRAAGYATVGALFGLLGGAVFASVDGVTGLGDGVRAVTGIAVGLFILAVGLGYVLRGSRASSPVPVPGVSRIFRRLNEALMARVDRLAGSAGILALGGVHAALPCPIIYPAYLYAFATGSPVRGGVSLAALGLGTIPALLAYGTALGSLSPEGRAGLHRLLGAAFVVLAYVPLSHGLALLGVGVPHLDLPYYQPLT